MKVHSNTADTEELFENFEVNLPENMPKNHTSLTHRTFAKVTVFILTVIMMTVASLGTVGAVYMLNRNVYSSSQSEFTKNQFLWIAYCDIENILSDVVDSDNYGYATQYCQNRNIHSVAIINDSSQIIWSYNDGEKNKDLINFEFSNLDWYTEYDEYGNEIFGSTAYTAKISVYEDLTFDDEYMLAGNFSDFLYSMKYKIYPFTIIALICTAVGIIFLMCSSGHKKGYEEVRPGWGAKIPFDLITGTAAALVIIAICIASNIYPYPSDMVIGTLIITVTAFVIAAVILGWLMCFAARIKLGKWWKNTLIYRLLRLIRRGARALLSLFKKIPLVWKTAVIFAGVSIIELIVLMCCWYEYGLLIVLWVIGTLILGTAVLYCAVKLKALQEGGEALANGDLSYQIDTTRLYGDFKKHGESLNSIAKGMTIAVEERLKSERLKTELITNVSHDIKTPLTSIINYTDLISKEPCENEKITEYSEVLLRQSQRLKRLIEDLVEASKASTGNIEVLLAPCNANILLTQAAGEYKEKLEAKNLELITTQPDMPVMIMADGRRLWRVFDNLLNNICKYAQSYTRVYLSLEQIGNEAVIIFKNTSHAPLNVSADELMERFVRGDSSRNTEGNGLGLSIAKSLIELQNGSFNLFIDGDLFKVILRFAII